MEEGVMRKMSSVEKLIFIVILVTGGGLTFAYHRVTQDLVSTYIGILIVFAVARLVSLAIRVADQWERVVVLRLGKFRALEGPGLSVHRDCTVLD